MDKQTALKQLSDEFDKLLAAVDGLDDRAMTTKFYGEWAVKDILAHISGWHHLMTDAMERMTRGEKPTPEGVDYSDADAWNAKFASAVSAIGPRTVLATWQQTHMNYVKAAQALPDDRFGESDGKPKTANRLIETSGFGHYREHLPAILEFRAKLAA